MSCFVYSGSNVIPAKNYNPALLFPWSQVGSINEKFFSLVSVDGTMFAGARTDGDDPQVWSWNGSSWDDEDVVDSSRAAVNWNCMIDVSNVLYVGCGTDQSNVYYLTEGTPNVWTDTGRPGTASNCRSLTLHNSTLYAGTGSSGGLVCEYSPPSTWTSIGRPGSSNNSLTASDGTDLFACSAETSTVYKWAGSGTTWNSVGTAGSTGANWVIRYISGVLYVCTYSGGAEVFYYTAPSTWTSVGTLGSETGVLDLIEHDSTLYAATYSGTAGKVYEHQGGTSWSVVGNFEKYGAYCTSLLSFGGDLYCSTGAATSDGFVWKYTG